MHKRTALAIIALAVAAGAVQCAASVTLRQYAVRGAWPALVNPAFAERFEQVEAGLPLPPPLILVSARAALDAGDTTRAAALIARLAATPDRLALEGRLAADRGDTTAAVRAFLAAGDLADVERRVGLLRSAKRFRDAIDLQNELIARLQSDTMQRDTLAQADWLLGQLEEAMAYSLYITSPKRPVHEERALAAYARALAISPNQQRYLIAYGNQLLNVGRFADARETFLRARALDARDSTALAGIGEAALGMGDRAAAVAALQNARLVNAADPAVVRLAREIGS